MVVIGALTGLLLAAHNAPLLDGFNPFVYYVYGFVRVALHGVFFFAARAVIEKYNATLSLLPLTALAIAASHVPLVLTVSAIDIVIGQPELGVAAGAEQSRLALLLWELVYFADNHIAICCLLSVPRVLLQQAANAAAAQHTADSAPTTLISSISPPIDGEILWVEAQEHYVRIVTAEQNRLVLARFSDIVRELSSEPGMQVHRSHWVRTTAVVGTQRNAQSLTLTLDTGDTVPVSRRYRQAVEKAIDPAPPGPPTSPTAGKPD